MIKAKDYLGNVTALGQSKLQRKAQICTDIGIRMRKSFFKTNFYVEDVYLKYTFFKRRKPFEDTSAFFNAKTLFTFKISLVNPLSERHCFV